MSSSHITNIKQSQKRIKSTVLFNESIINAFDDPVLLYDLNHSIQKVNDAFIQSYGFDPSGLCFEDFSALFNSVSHGNYSLDSEVTLKAFQGKKSGGIVFQIVFGEQEHSIEASSFPLLIENKVLGAITIWRKLNSSYGLLETQWKFDKKMVDRSPLPILITRNGFIEYLNPLAMDLIGATHQKELMGKPIRDIIQSEFGALKKYATDDISHKNTTDDEHELLRLDGALRTVELMAVSISDKPDRVIQLYLKDITSRKKAEFFNSTLTSIEHVINSTINTNEIAEKAMRMAANATGCDSAAVSFLIGDFWEVIHTHNLPDHVQGLTISKEEEPHATLALTGKTSVLIEDAYTDPRVNNLRMKDWGIKSVIVTPLFTSHRDIGVIFFNFYNKKIFSPEKTIFLTRLSTALSLSLENSELFDSLQEELEIKKNTEQKLLKLNNTLLALSRSSQAMLHANSEKEYTRQICDIITTDCNQALAWVGFIESNQLTPFVWSGKSEGYIETLVINLAPGNSFNGPSSTAVSNKTPIICSDIETAPEFAPWRDEAIKFGIGSCISLPLIYLDNVYGVLNIYSKEKHAFLDDEVSLLYELSKYLSQGLVSIRLNKAKIQAEDNLRESEERFRMLTETSNALICELDMKGKILYGNVRFRETFGASIINETIFSFCPLESIQELFDHIYCPNRPGLNEWKLKDKEGNWRWFRCHSGLFVTTRSGERCSLMLFDIGDIKQAEERLKQNANQLKELNATKDKFFNIIAHDLKNPFTGLMGGSELLLSSMDDKETVLKLGKMIHDSARRGYSLLQNLLEWSRTQTGAIHFEPVQINLLDLINDSMEGLKAFCQSKSQEIKIYIPENLEVYADINMLSTIIRNLVQNAVKFSHTNSTINIYSENSNDGIVVSVEDHGIGIAPENIENLFRIDEKVSTPGTLNETGTGLGLLLCKEFIEKHKGKIWVRSTQGKGSVFSFLLPN